MEQDITTIVLTGGACGGKTGVLAILRQKLEELGYVVVTCSEGATDYILDGITPNLMGAENFQRHLFRSIMQRERLRKEALESINVPKKILILDRTVHDAAAYMSDSEYLDLLRFFGYTKTQVRDERYDGVIFLRSLAHDKPELYSTANNAARKESLEDAQKLDERTLAVWVGAPHLRIIDNSTDLEGKALRVIQAVYRVLGIPEPLEIERKYCVGSFSLKGLPEHHQRVDIEQQYLRAVDAQHTERVRKRGQNGNWSYYHTIKRDVRSSVRTEIERRITLDEYRNLLTRADPTYRAIKKVRHCFVYKNQYCELDVFENMPGLILFEVELTHEHRTHLGKHFFGIGNSW